MSITIVPYTGSELALADNMREAFKTLAYGLSEGSERQYRHTFKCWDTFCQEMNLNPDELSSRNVLAFLEHSDLARRTKMARLTHLRKLAQTLQAGDIENRLYEQNYKQLQLLRLPKKENDENAASHTRSRNAFSERQVQLAINHWRPDTNQGKRNRALLSILFYAGLRRSEAARLKWEHIDFAEGLVAVIGGKARESDNTDEVPIPPAVWADLKHNLLQWRECIPDYEFVFVGINKGDRIISSEHISTETIRRVTKASGLPDFKPHDARRTVITILLNSGSNVADVQAFARHKNPSTTLGYAVVANAKVVQGRLRWGERATI